MGAATVSSIPHLIRHRFVLSRPTLAPYLSFPQTTTFRPVSLRSLFSSPNATLSVDNDVASLHDDSDAPPPDGQGPMKILAVETKASPPPPPPILSIKEKKGLSSHAQSLGKKLKSQQIGKSGVTDTVVTALIETLEANELLKLKIHGTCPGEFDEVVRKVEETTGSLSVGQIGRTVILYRPSLTKMKAEEEKRRRAQRRQQQNRRAVMVLGQKSRPSWRAGHGNSSSRS